MSTRLALPYAACVGERYPPTTTYLPVASSWSFASSQMRRCISVGGENEPHETTTTGSRPSGRGPRASLSIGSAAWSPAASEAAVKSHLLAPKPIDMPFCVAVTVVPLAPPLRLPSAVVVVVVMVVVVAMTAVILLAPSCLLAPAHSTLGGQHAKLRLVKRGCPATGGVIE